MLNMPVAMTINAPTKTTGVTFANGDVALIAYDGVSGFVAEYGDQGDWLLEAAAFPDMDEALTWAFAYGSQFPASWDEEGDHIDALFDQLRNDQ